jgi:TorA maturation chaperone TorD
MLDYSRLFLGPFDILAKPYGSVYLDGEKVVMGDSTMQALELYREGGFDVAEDFREMPDHIAVELEFLYLLSFRIGQESDDEERTRLVALKHRFFENHLGRWVGTLCEAIRDGAETDFYKLLAGLTETFVREDLKELIEAK